MQIFSLGIVLDGSGFSNKYNLADQQILLSYIQSIGGCNLKFDFPVINLGYWLDKQDQLEQIAKSNPFAIIVMSQLAAVQHKNLADRFNPKIDLYRKLLKYGYPIDKTRLLLRLMDWIVKLPAGLEQEYRDQLDVITKENEMAYVTPLERIDLERATAIGVGLGQSGLLLSQLQRRFGDIPDAIINRVKTATQNQLEHWALNILDAETLDEVFAE